MIKEFALDPEVLAVSFRDFSYFIEKFGVAQGRVISRFPKDWKKFPIFGAHRFQAMHLRVSQDNLS